MPRRTTRLFFCLNTVQILNSGFFRIVLNRATAIANNGTPGRVFGTTFVQKKKKNLVILYMDKDNRLRHRTRVHSLCRLLRPRTTETTGRFVRVFHFAQATAPGTGLWSRPVYLFVAHRLRRSLGFVFICENNGKRRQITTTTTTVLVGDGRRVHRTHRYSRGYSRSPLFPRRT